MPRPWLQPGDVITGEPQLYVTNRACQTFNFTVEPQAISQVAKANLVKRFTAAVRRNFSLGTTPEVALTAGIDKAFAPLAPLLHLWRRQMTRLGTKLD